MFLDIYNPESTAWNPESKTVLDPFHGVSASWDTCFYIKHSENYSTELVPFLSNNRYIPPFF